MATITQQHTTSSPPSKQRSGVRLTPLEWVGGVLALVFAVIALGELGALSSHVATAHVRQGRMGAVLGLVWFGGLALTWLIVVTLRLARRFRAQRAARLAAA